MSEKKIRAVIVGAGNVGRLVTRYAVEDGIEIVGAIGHVNNLGADVGELAGIGPLGVPLEKDGPAVLDRTKPDVALINTCNTMEEVYDQFEMCLSRGINIVTACGQPYKGVCFNKELSEKLDELAKANGATLLATGVEDVFWNELVTVLTAGVRNITEIKGSNIAVLDDFGPMTLELCNAGLTVEEFNDMVNNAGEIAATAFLPTMSILADQLGLTIVDRKDVIEPVIAKADIHLDQWDIHIPAGRVAGTREVLTFKTAEGITLIGQFTGKLGEPGDDQGSFWSIKGEPNMDNITADINGNLTTAICVANRIPDVINARPGYLTVADMPMPAYHSKPAASYLK